MNVDDAECLKALEKKNSEHKQMYADGFGFRREADGSHSSFHGRRT